MAFSSAEQLGGEPQHDWRPSVLVHGQVRVKGSIEPIRWTGEFPEGRIYDGLKLTPPGYGGFKRSSRALRNASSQIGLASISYDPARLSYDTWGMLNDPQQLHGDTVEAIALDLKSKSDLIKRQVPESRSLNFERFMLEPHSMGGFAADIMASRHPEKVESIIYLASANFGHPCISDYIKGNLIKDLGDLKDEIVELGHSGYMDVSLKTALQGLKYYLINPARSLREGLACITQNNSELVAELGNLGVKTAYLGFENDCLVKVKDVLPEVESIVDATRVLPGLGHVAPQAHPYQVANASWELHQQITH